MVDPKLLDVKARYESQLVSMPGVIGVGATENGIIVYVRTEEDAMRLPKEIEGVPVIPRIVGEVRIL